jgi:hypothetical protein
MIEPVMDRAAIATWIGGHRNIALQQFVSIRAHGRHDRMTGERRRDP